MQDKELESLLQKKADEIKMRDFSLVWEEIKGEIQEPVKEKKFRWKKWFPMILASAAMVVCIALTPIIIKSLTPPPEEVFYTEELRQQDVLKEDMLSGLTQAQIPNVDINNYVVEECKLLITEDNKVKGSAFTFYNEPFTFFAELNLYDKSVDLNLDIELLYDTTYKVNSTDVHYKLKQESGGVYDYSVYAICNNVQYVIEYKGLSDNLIDFLNDFFG
ncbi:MAG: hypothetical protein IJX16_03970 [Clostridia bacterium]|nr:hypothetical protein [Clostridia bacterium]